MKTAAIIAEYNPFHKGHLYQIKNTPADCIVVLMSGDFVQCGEPSVYPKHQRAKTALLNGADLVLELPCLYALSGAESFALGAIKTLNALSSIDFLCFGSEMGEILPLEKIADVLILESPKFKETLQQHLFEGCSFAEAREAALCAEGADQNIIKTPNNILGVEYIKALKNTQSNIQPFTIKRNTEFKSAREIRETLSDSVSFSDFEKMLLYSLSFPSVVPFDGGDGVWERLLKADKSSLSSLFESAKSKRHTMARIKRCVLHTLLQNDLSPFTNPSYIRVLASNKKGTEFLSSVKKSAALPIITKPSAYSNAEDKIWQLENKAADIYSLAAGLPLGRNLKTSPYICK